MPVGCLIVCDGIVTAANPEATEVLGFPHGKLVKTALHELLLPEFEERCVTLLEDADDRSKYLQVRLAKGASAIEFAIRRVGDQTAAVAVRSLRQELYYSAAAKGDLTHDQTTGLPNRYYVLSELERQLTPTTLRPLSVVGVWVDDLDGLGKKRGRDLCDKILAEVANRLEAKLRSPDLLGRFDQTGFLAILRSDVDISQLTEIGDRLRDEIAFPVEIDDKLVSFTTSIAIGSVEDECPSAGRVVALLQAAANRALTSGGDRTEVVRL